MAAKSPICAIREELIASGLLTPGALPEVTPTITSGPVLRARLDWRHEQRAAERRIPADWWSY
jgi:hypothetical protein